MTAFARRLRCPAAALSLALCAACAAPRAPESPHGVGALRLIGAAVLTRTDSGPLRDFGGISGADYDPSTGTWYLLPDDRSEHAPARVYTARMEIGPQGLGAIDVTGSVVLRQADGSTFPSPREPGEVPDPEALRLAPDGRGFFWSSEGDRRRDNSPFVRQAGFDGRFVAGVALPSNLRTHANEERGTRDNLSFEGLAFADGGRTLWVSMEAPLYEDGPVPTPAHGAFARFTRLDRASGRSAQFAYPVDAVPLAPTGGKRRCDNGVSEILPVADGASLLVLERSGREVADGVFAFEVRLYEADAAGATDVGPMASLQGASFVPMRKRLVLDFNRSGLGWVDNLEAAAWGPRLPDGHRTLVLMSDDNYSPRQATQVLVYEVE
jgi:hypothetical protein